MVSSYLTFEHLKAFLPHCAAPPPNSTMFEDTIMVLPTIHCNPAAIKTVSNDTVLASSGWQSVKCFKAQLFHGTLGLKFADGKLNNKLDLATWQL